MSVMGRYDRVSTCMSTCEDANTIEFLRQCPSPMQLRTATAWSGISGSGTWHALTAHDFLSAQLDPLEILDTIVDVVTSDDAQFRNVRPESAAEQTKKSRGR